MQIINPLNWSLSAYTTGDVMVQQLSVSLEPGDKMPNPIQSNTFITFLKIFCLKSTGFKIFMQIMYHLSFLYNSYYSMITSFQFRNYHATGSFASDFHNLLFLMLPILSTIDAICAFDVSFQPLLIPQKM